MKASVGNMGYRRKPVCICKRRREWDEGVPSQCCLTNEALCGVPLDQKFDATASRRALSDIGAHPSFVAQFSGALLKHCGLRYPPHNNQDCFRGNKTTDLKFLALILLIK